MKQYRLKYNSEVEAFGDLYQRGIINEDRSFGSNALVVVFKGFEVITEATTDENGGILIPAVIGTDYFVELIIKGVHTFPNSVEITQPVASGFVEAPTDFKTDLDNDMEFGKKLISQFLLDNRNQATPFTPQESGALLQKFSVVKALVEVGDVKNMKLILSSIETDTIFTQERKDKYVTLTTNYLNSK